jgi:excisionase family DNA binding protein
MSSISPLRRGIAPATATTLADVQTIIVPHVLRFTMTNGVLEIEGAAMATRLLEQAQGARFAAEAEQAALSTIYRLSGEPDESRPCGGLLTRRLDISERTAYALITEGRLKYTCLGRKAYRVSEAAVRELLGDLPVNK